MESYRNNLRETLQNTYIMDEKDCNFMEQSKLDRINELANKSRKEGLTEQEKQEQTTLRNEYIESYRNNLRETLQNTYIMDEKGNKTKLKEK